MRALLFHCREYETRIDSLSNRPEGIAPEEVNGKEQKGKDCIVAFLTVEKNDDVEKTSAGLGEEIAKMAEEVGRKNVILVPFAHLSKNLASSSESKKALDTIEKRLKQDFNVARAHFGSHKSLLLNVYGHPGNVRYREF